MWNREVHWIEARQGCLSLMWTMKGSTLGPDLKQVGVEVRRKWTRLVKRERPT